MNRDVLKSGAASVLHRTGLYKLIGTINGTRRLPVVIGYHRVVENFEESLRTAIPSLLISQRMLERHLDWIGRRYRIVGLDELGTRMESGIDGKPLAAIMFDDGYADFYHYAFPILQKKGIPGAVFVMTGLTDSKEIPAHDQLYLLLQRRIGRLPLPQWDGIHVPDLAGMTAYQATRVLIEAFPLRVLEEIIESLKRGDEIPDRLLEPFRLLTWDQLRRVRRAGITVGSHTRTHVVLTNENASKVREELAGSKADLEAKLGEQVRHFVYPSGFFNRSSVDEVAAAGYAFAYTGCTHRSLDHPLLTVPRTVLWEKSSLDSRHDFSGSVLNCQIYHAFDLAGGCKQRHAMVN